MTKEYLDSVTLIRGDCLDVMNKLIEEGDLE